MGRKNYFYIKIFSYTIFYIFFVIFIEELAANKSLMKKNVINGPWKIIISRSADVGIDLSHTFLECFMKKRGKKDLSFFLGRLFSFAEIMKSIFMLFSIYFMKIIKIVHY